ncbi:Hypothetical predicted protein [Mytilus galloprovincialis]|uniref:Integrase catalytic domain-containing protein n=1 Tax=Mytilus galloprovincialis TaxID=29158 RepID=A0A8B6EXB1_MYTGA|nr:Hypothetical predicted protein [Mytilus galloprovincialis]
MSKTNLTNKLADELHHRVVKSFPKRRVYVHSIDQTWAVDLIDMQPYSKQNKHYKYLLAVIDVFSKYGWLIPLKNKTGVTVSEAFKTLFKERKPIYIWSDKGSEFYNRQVKEFLFNNYCKTIMPKPGKNILEFNNHHFKNRLPFVIYCDFEAYNIPMQSCTPDPNKSYIKPISKQEINSYGMYVHSDYPEIYKPQYFSYVGDDAVEKYVEKVMKIYKEITYKIYLNEKKKLILNNHEEDEFQEATGCYICGEEFKESEKVREHNHLSGKYRGAACQSCNTKEGLTWQCGLKYTEIKLELLTDVDMLQMFEKGIRGGFSGVLGPRHVKAFNKYTSNYE